METYLGFTPPVQPSVNPQQANSLVAALKAQSPPANPAGAAQKDQNMSHLLDYQRIRVSLERAQENEPDPVMGAVLEKMHGAIIMRLQGVDGQTVLQSLAVGTPSMAPLAAPPGGMPPVGMQAPPPPPMAMGQG